MIKSYNNISLAVGIPGLVLQGAAYVVEWPSGQEAIGTAVFWLGTALLLVGLAFYAMAKRRHPTWCLLGFLSILGVIILGLLPDSAKSESAK